MPSDEYSDVLAWLYGLQATRGMDFKLERVRFALERLGSPQESYAAVLIAGTNGKGSVAAMLHSVLSAAGYRAGLYTSPHLVEFTERIRIGDDEITPEQVVDLTGEIRRVADEQDLALTFFEIVTLVAFLHFARCGISIAVVEVGLGGRLDATNVLSPVVSVITTIALDHEEFLGNTHASVAREKAGILRAGRPVVIGELPADAVRVVAETASALRCPLIRIGEDFELSEPVPHRFSGLGGSIDAIYLSLRGAHQRHNAAVAIAALRLLGPAFHLSDDDIRRGLERVRWPGRLEIVATQPLIIVDVAHNVAGVDVLRSELPALVGDRRMHLLFAVMRDKRWLPMLDRLTEVAASVTLTTVLPPRGENPEVLARRLHGRCPVRVISEPVPAISTLLRETAPSEAILVTGSIFLVGVTYPILQSQALRASGFGEGTTPRRLNVS
jgi:dihydrofolate synthase/folylpolyglutamate synthase